MGLNIQLQSHQDYSKNVILQQPFVLLALGMGAGKTLTTLSALYEINPSGHVLIVAPKNIARATWSAEIKKWNIPIRTKSLIVNEKGKKLSRKKRLERYAAIPTDPPTMYFINRDLIVDLVENMPIEKGRPVWYFPTVVLDESQSFKDPSTNRFKALKKVRPCITRLIELSGTPAPEGLLDLWSQIYLLDQGARLGTSMTKYKETFFRATRFVQGRAVEWELLPGAAEEIYNRVRDIMISIQNPDVVLPPIMYQDLTISLSDEEQALYKTMLKDSVLEFGDDIPTVIARNAAVLHGRLSQMASGALYIDEQKNYKVIHEQKLDMCEYLIENADGNILIAYKFQSDRSMLMKRFPDAKLFDGSEQMIDAWNAGTIPVMLLQPASAGHGLNIQEGGHTLIWYTIPDSLEHYLQTVARLWRQGQPDPVTIYHLLAEGTIDMKLIKSIQKKTLELQELMNAVSVDDVIASINTPNNPFLNQAEQSFKSELRNIYAEALNEALQ